MKYKIKRKVFNYGALLFVIGVVGVIVCFFYFPLIAYFKTKNVDYLFLEIILLSYVFFMSLAVGVSSFVSEKEDIFYAEWEEIVELEKVKRR